MAKNQFAQLLKYYLSLNGKTQSDLVNALGYDKSTVSGWCSGIRVPKIDTIIDIATYLHVEPGDLILDNDRNEQYYLDDDAAAAAQFLYENPDYKVLFDATRKVKPEDIQLVKELLDRFSEK